MKRIRQLLACLATAAAVVTGAVVANDFYDHSSGVPSTGSLASSASMRAEFDSIAAGFDLMPVLTGAGDQAVFVNSGGSALTTQTAANARTLLGVAIGTDVQAFDATLQSLSALGTAADRMAYTTALDTWAETPITAFARTVLDDIDAATARTTFGLGTIATQNANAVSITGGTVTGITDLAVADGGTGASTAAVARSNLGLGTIATVNSPVPVANGGTGSTTASGARTNLGAAASGANSDITSITGLTTDLAVTHGGTGASTAAAARSNLGAAASGANSDITSLTGLTTDLAVTHGGTGASTAAAARANLGAAPDPVQQANLGFTVGEVLEQTFNPSGVASVTVGSLQADTHYRLVVLISKTSATARLNLRANNDSTAGRHGIPTETNRTEIPIDDVISTGDGFVFSVIHFHTRPGDSSEINFNISTSSSGNNNTNVLSEQQVGKYNGTAISSMVVFIGDGTFTGTIKLYKVN